MAPLNEVKQLDPGGQLSLAADEFLAMGVEKANQCIIATSFADPSYM